MFRRAVKKTILWAGLLSLVFSVMTGCADDKETIVTNKDDILRTEDDGASEPSLPAIREDEEEETGGDTGGPITLPKVSDEKKAVPDTFTEAVAFLNRTGGVLPEIDYDTVKYTASKRDTSKEADKRTPKEIEEAAAGDEIKTVRMHRSGNGATIDFTVNTDPESRMIDKIVSTEYGSEGREVTGFYFKNGNLVYAYRYMNDLYGINAEDARKSGGLRCYFTDDFMSECYATYGESNESVTAASYADVNEDIKKEYDELEEELINRAYVNYNALRVIPSTALIYGYVADEYGGVLSNTLVTIRSEANAYEKKVVTNGDGYYEISVPVNTSDWYNMVFEYGDFAPSSVNDVYIRPRTLEYPIGVTYMAPSGQNKHDTDTYLLDVTKQSPDKLKENQYEVVLTFNNEKIEDLTPFTLDLNTGRYENNKDQVITVDRDSDYKYFVADRKNGKAGNNLTNDMSLSEAQIKVYNKNSLVASFQVPVGRSGVVWEVFEIRGAEIIPSNNYYFESGKNIFFN